MNPDAPEHERSRELLEGWRRGGRPWFLTWGIVYEFLRVASHRRVFPRPLDLSEAWTFVRAVRASPSCHLLVETDRHADVLDELAASDPELSGNLAHDLHTAALMKEHGVAEIRTRDADFRRFSHLRAVDPLA